MSRGSHTIFVGNIPYDATEEELKAVFSRAGNVDSFRLVFDKDTKQPRGYGFCDFVDAETARNAIRNLQDVEFNGRSLRVDLADNALRREGMAKGGLLALPAPPSSSMASMSSTAPPPAHLPLPCLPMPAQGPIAPDLPAGPGGPRRAAVPDFLVDSNTAAAAKRQEEMLHELRALTDIAQTVVSMPAAQLQVCLGTMQRLASEAPETARALLQEYPQLAYALLHAQMLQSLGQQQCAPPTLEEMQQLKMLAAAKNPTPKQRAGGPRPAMLGLVIPPVPPAALAAGLLPGFRP
mmetsp:Transcript_30424/g.70050  ORF Transcript_30424/g.70050 Transcript_30424/m.70050 type:complete len:293 (+) Transcript_30424:58-936(+)